MKPHLAFAVAVAVIAPAAAFADEWTPTQEFQRAQTASLRIIEPEGYKVTVNGKADTVPAVFNFDNADSYVVVRLESPAGASWEKKFEVKAWNQTVVRVRHTTGTAAPTNNKKARTYVGVLANTLHVCRYSKDRVPVMLEVVADQVVKTVVLQPRSRENVDLPAGTYDVRVYKPFREKWAYTQTLQQTVTKDGWSVNVKCD
jgi:hypothetical protein